MTNWRPRQRPPWSCRGYIFEQFQRAIDEGAQDNLLGDMATAYAHGDIDQVTAAVIMVILFSAGGESTASLLGSAVGIPAERPEISGACGTIHRLLGPFIEECLRFEPPFRGHYRHVRVDTELAGVPLPANSRLLLLWVRPTAIRQSSTTPASSGWTVRPRAASLLGRACTSASARRWPGWRRRWWCGAAPGPDRWIRGAGSRAVVVSILGCAGGADLC